MSELPRGTAVRTARLLERRDFAGTTVRRANASGLVVRTSDAHGLCYEVLHVDGVSGFYDPDELTEFGAAVIGVDESAVPWSTEKRPVPEFEGWSYAGGKGGPCWYAHLNVDTYTHVMLTPGGYVSARDAPVGVVRWLLDNAPVESGVSR